MKRREFITLLGGAAAWPLSAFAQPQGTIWRVGVLSIGSASTASHLVEASSLAFDDQFCCYAQGGIPTALW
jgi:hypothetical protein